METKFKYIISEILYALNPSRCSKNYLFLFIALAVMHVTKLGYVLFILGWLLCTIMTKSRFKSSKLTIALIAISINLCFIGLSPIVNKVISIKNVSSLEEFNLLCIVWFIAVALLNLVIGLQVYIDLKVKKGDLIVKELS